MDTLKTETSRVSDIEDHVSRASIDGINTFLFRYRESKTHSLT